MWLKLIIIPLIFMFPANSYAKASFYDLIVGGTIKNLAKIYVKTSNLTKLKVKYVKKIENMKNDKFNKNYAKFYDVYKQLPVDLKNSYVFSEKGTKSAVIKMIVQVNKNDLIKIINKIPSEFILKQSKVYGSSPNSHLPQEPSASGVHLWNRLLQKI